MQYSLAEWSFSETLAKEAPMTTDGNAARVADVKIFHVPCAFNPKGVSEAVCIATTRIISRNVGCCSIKCTSKVRACKACLLEAGEPRKVKDPVTGLCEYHLARGAETPRPAPPQQDRPPLIRRATEPAPIATTPATPPPVPRKVVGPKEVVTPIAKKPTPEAEPEASVVVNESSKPILADDKKVESSVLSDPIRSAGYDPKVALLPSRTIKVLDLLVEGLMNVEVASKLQLKVGDVGMIITRLYKHLEISGPAEGNRDVREGAKRRNLIEKYLRHRQVYENFGSRVGLVSTQSTITEVPIPQEALTEIEIQKWIGGRIRRRRIALGLTTTQLGDATNLSMQQLQHYERGDYLSAGRLLLIARALSTSVAYFYFGIEQPEPNLEQEEASLAAIRKARGEKAYKKLVVAVQEVRSILDSES